MASSATTVLPVPVGATTSRFRRDRNADSNTADCTALSRCHGHRPRNIGSTKALSSAPPPGARAAWLAALPGSRLGVAAVAAAAWERDAGCASGPHVGSPDALQGAVAGGAPPGISSPPAMPRRQASPTGTGSAANGSSAPKMASRASSSARPVAAWSSIARAFRGAGSCPPAAHWPIASCTRSRSARPQRLAAAGYWRSGGATGHREGRRWGPGRRMPPKKDAKKKAGAEDESERPPGAPARPAARCCWRTTTPPPVPECDRPARLQSTTRMWFSRTTRRLAREPRPVQRVRVRPCRCACQATAKLPGCLGAGTAPPQLDRAHASRGPDDSPGSGGG